MQGDSGNQDWVWANRQGFDCSSFVQFSCKSILQAWSERNDDSLDLFIKSLYRIESCSLECKNFRVNSSRQDKGGRVKYYYFLLGRNEAPQL